MTIGKAMKSEIDQAEDTLFEVWDRVASDSRSPAVLLVNVVADGPRNEDGSADGHSGHSKYRLPPGWQPSDVAVALSNLVMEIADRESWPREKLIGMLTEECISTARDLAPLKRGE